MPGQIFCGMAKFASIAVGPDDWRVWREIRRAALTEAPEAFGSSLADWTGVGYLEERWRARLRDVPVNLILALEDEPVGMVSVTAPDPRAKVELISLWVAPQARGRGVGDEAVRQAIAVAAQRFPSCGLELSVRAENRPAVALYQRHGFVDAGPSPDDACDRLMQR